MENSKENMHYYVRAKRVIPPVPVVLYERKELEPKVFNSSSELPNEISGVNDAFR